ncbi:MAG: Fe-S cluster assembly protein SufD [Proteobacteria bacterium]|nr:Fe-S cluster assembly protein SufD [Pseudomonadota bacterium]
MAAKTDTSEAYVHRFAEAKATLAGHGLPWLAGLRERAIERFAALGFPTRRIEEWKFTDLRALTRTTFSPAPRLANGVTGDAVGRFLPADLPSHLLVFVNGHHRADLSDVGELPAGVRLCGLAEALAEAPELLEEQLCRDGALDGHAPLALNTAFMTDGAVLMLARGVALERPVHLLFLATGDEAPAVAHPRNIIVAEAASRATVIETYAAPAAGAYWTNAVTDIVMEADASVRHVKVQAESHDAFHLAVTRVRLAKGSAYNSFVASVGGRLARNEITAVLGEGVECRLGGVYLARGRQHLDTTTLIDHARPASFSNEHYRGVLDDSAHGVFQGKIIIRPDAQKTDAHQLNKNLLLSRTAHVDTKPELEIHADDVKCSHGAATGALDAEALFYLRSRGLDTDLAQRLLIEAFVGEIIDEVETTALRAHLRRVAAAWLTQVNK